MNEKIDSNSVSSALPGDIRGDFERHGVSADIRNILEVAYTQRGFTSNLVPPRYVSVSPDNGGSVASYVHHERLTVAMPPRTAESVGSRYGWKVERRSSITSYVKISAAGLATETQRSTAVELLVEAIRWRALGS